MLTENTYIECTEWNGTIGEAITAGVLDFEERFEEIYNAQNIKKPIYEDSINGKLEVLADYRDEILARKLFNVSYAQVIADLPYSRM